MNYTLVRLMDRGGMGAVWLVKKDEIEYAVNGNQKCSDFGNSECSIFGIKTTLLLASAVQ